jgi:hypothetical protein
MTPAIILGAIDLITRLLDFVKQQKAIAAQTNAWSPADRAAIDAKWTTLQASPAWQTDADTKGTDATK